ncbi:MAG: MarR family transcriptional regulator [Acidimicrobiia bacterium]|nr:MarR family transcriptional regulator [Acidimicrobiia bacterium]
MEPESDLADAATAAWSRIAPDVDLQAFGIVIRLIRAGRLMEASLDRAAAAHGFDVRGDYEVLATLRRGHPTPLRPQDLADQVMISSPGMTGRLDRLENAGLIERASHPTDRRSTFISITPNGIELADRTFRSVIDDAAQLLDGFPDTARHRLTQELRQLLIILGDTS